MEAAAIERKSIDAVFGVDGGAFRAHGSQSTTTIRVFAANDDTPDVIEGFAFQPDTLRRILVWMASGALPNNFTKATMKRNLLIYGPTGCGKTALISQVCARTGRSMFRYQCSEDSEATQLFGTYKLCKVPQNAERQEVEAEASAAPQQASALSATPEMVFVDGPVLRWARTPNSILLLDEFDQLPPSVAMSMNGVLDGDDILVPETGERVKIAAGCLIVATGNTNGRGSAGGNGGSASLYKGVKRQNIASLDRFFVVNATYLSVEEEIALLQDQVGMPETAATAMAKLASSLRSRFVGLNEDAGANGEPLEFTITTRNLLNWGLTHRLLMATGLDSTNAFKEGLSMTLLDFGTGAERKAVLDAWENIIGE
ncbi:MoxR family ATPase (plasmid) [Cupriavidus pauculus]|uniref:MoxR family ATPase n=3 Tax=Burkholderiaceae TaxID=119060 RepID=A0A3G8GVK4_9BURK|nr:MoxR family ATPase [Cupriavidus pauculus]QBP14608.1 MoxR family ATPase [Cupriavidus metallidurans]